MNTGEQHSASVNESGSATVSFDRMRNMLTRAAEIRESEQQQVFDALDEIHARLSPLDSIGSVRKRLSELPDRTEVGVIAERLDEAMAKLEAQETAIASLARALDSVVDHVGQLAENFAASHEEIRAQLGQLVAAATNRHAVSFEPDSRERRNLWTARPEGTGEVPTITGDPLVDLILYHIAEEAAQLAGPPPSVETLLEGVWGDGSSEPTSS